MIDEDRPGHTHRLPRAVLLTLVIICGGLVVSLVLVSTLAYQAQHQSEVTNQRLAALEEFIADRGEMRDEQYRTLGEQLNAFACGLLDKLPAGPILDPLRTTYGCGPGLPPEALSPEAQQQLQRYAEADPQPAAKPAVPSPETTDAPAPTPTVVAPPVAPDEPPAPTPGLPPVAPAAPTAPPLVDLTPLTDPLCSGLGLCL